MLMVGESLSLKANVHIKQARFNENYFGIKINEWFNAKNYLLTFFKFVNKIYFLTHF